MFAVEVRDHIMIAHSLPDPFFGPAQGLHGATYVVDVAFFREDLNAHGVVVDIGKAHEVLKATLQALNYKNLDEAMPGVLTTTEVLCKHIFDAVALAARNGDLGDGSEGLAKIRVLLNESHVARAWYEAAP